MHWHLCIAAVCTAGRKGCVAVRVLEMVVSLVVLAMKAVILAVKVAWVSIS